MARKWPAIDIIKLYSGKFPGFEDDYVIDENETVFNAHVTKQALNSHDKWNMWLERCHKSHDLNELMKVRYGLQAGMDDIVKKKLNTASVNEMFLRWCSSIERTARKILKEKNPIPNDSAKNKSLWGEDSLGAKRKRDQEFQRFLDRSAY